MPPQSQQPAGPEARRSRRADRRVTGREQRKVAAAEAERRKRWTIAAGTIALVLIVGLVAFLVTRPRDLGPPLQLADALQPSIPTAGSVVEGHSMGPADAPVTVVEWGDYT
jgi:hypothetical protein